MPRSSTPGRSTRSTRRASSRRSRRTGHAVIVHETWERGGYGGEIAAVIADRAWGQLRGPVKRVGARHTPIPFSPVLENFVLPQVDDIVAAVRGALGRSHGGVGRLTHPTDEEMPMAQDVTMPKLGLTMTEGLVRSSGWSRTARPSVGSAVVRGRDRQVQHRGGGRGGRDPRPGRGGRTDGAHRDGRGPHPRARRRAGRGSLTGASMRDYTMAELIRWCGVPVDRLDAHPERKVPLRLCRDSAEMGHLMALELVEEIERNERGGRGRGPSSRAARWPGTSRSRRWSANAA